MSFAPNIHHRRSLRLQGYDYTQAGAYFITLCVQHREQLFGAVMDSSMQLSPTGIIVRDTWEWLASHYDYLELDAFVIMPDHLHGILVLAPMTDIKRKSLGGLVGAFKTVSTKHINMMRNTPGTNVWQRNYYEHIIRNENDLHKIRAYIATNPIRWVQR